MDHKDIEELLSAYANSELANTQREFVERTPFELLELQIKAGQLYMGPASTDTPKRSAHQNRYHGDNHG